jgi:hydrogenase 3 maturation protease
VLQRKSQYNTEIALKKWLSKARRVVVAGIGNPLRMDDFVGMKVVQSLAGQISDRILLIECETVPESSLEAIVAFDPTHVLLVDAAILGIAPGETRLVKPEELISTPAISTHMLPLRIFCDYLANSTQAKVALLLIEPATTEFGEEMTKTLQDSVNRISAVLLRIFSHID